PTGYADDVQNPDVFFITYGTGDNLTSTGGETDVPESPPLDLFYSYTTDRGETFETVEVVNQNTGETEGRWDWLASGDPEQGEASVKLNPDGSRFYAVWHQATVLHDDEGHEELVDNDIWFRRVMAEAFLPEGLTWPTVEPVLLPGTFVEAVATLGWTVETTDDVSPELMELITVAQPQALETLTWEAWQALAPEALAVVPDAVLPLVAPELLDQVTELVGRARAYVAAHPTPEPAPELTPGAGPGWYVASLDSRHGLDAGRLRIWNSKEKLHLRVEPSDDWKIKEIEIYIGADPIPTAGIGIPVPSQFPYREWYADPIPEYRLMLDLAQDLGFRWGAPYEDMRLQNVAVHAYMFKVDATTGEKIAHEHFWAIGEKFPMPQALEQWPAVEALPLPKTFVQTAATAGVVVDSTDDLTPQATTQLLQSEPQAMSAVSLEIWAALSPETLAVIPDTSIPGFAEGFVSSVAKELVLTARAYLAAPPLPQPWPTPDPAALLPGTLVQALAATGMTVETAGDITPIRMTQIVKGQPQILALFPLETWQALAPETLVAVTNAALASVPADIVGEVTNLVGTARTYVAYSKGVWGGWFNHELVHPQRGHFIDSPVSGLSFRTPTNEGKTDQSGGFDYFPGERVELSVGSVHLGNPLADHKISPLDIFEQADAHDPRVINMARLLQSLDADGEPQAGIAITDPVVACLDHALARLGLSGVDFGNDAQVESVIQATVNVCQGVPGVSLVSVSADAAQVNLDRSLNTNMFRKNISRTPELPSAKAKFNIMTVWLPALKANGDPAQYVVSATTGITATGIPYYDENGDLIKVETEAKPLVSVYADAIEETGDHDVFAAISRDDGNTWKRMNISRAADRSSFTLANGEEYYGHARKPVFQVKGNKILVAWTSKFCRGGKPAYAIDTEDDYIYDDPYWVDDIWGVAGPQRSVDYTEGKGPIDDYPEVGEIPYSCVWTARGLILTQGDLSKPPWNGTDENGDPLYELGDIVWFKPERLTSGRRDAFQLFAGGASSAGFALVWQEDPDGLRPGQACGPGPGWSGATTNKSTDIWYSYITWSDFGKVDTHFEPGGDPEHDDTEVMGRPKALVPMALPIRLSDNDKVNTDNLKVLLDEDGYPVEDEYGNWIPITNTVPNSTSVPIGDSNGDGSGSHRYGYMVDGLCEDFYEFINPQGALKRVCITADGRLLNGDTGASRPNVFLQTYTKPDGSKSAWAIIGYEETKGVGSGAPDHDGSGDGEHDGSNNNGAEEDSPDLGKNVIYHSFDFQNPDLVSAGTIINLPERGEDGNLVYLTEVITVSSGATATVQITDHNGLPMLAYENARRPRFVLQGKSAMGASKTVLLLLYKQGEEGKGRPSDIFARRFVVTGKGNPYDPKYLVCEATEVALNGQVVCAEGGAWNVSSVTPTETWVNPDRDENAQGEGTKVIRWEQTEDNLYDASSLNPYGDARAHRGQLRGDFVVIGYSYTPNWAASRNGNDKYDFYVRRSFDGGATWTTMPAIQGGEGVTNCLTFKDPETKEKEEVCTFYGPGEFEAARNVSQLPNNKESVIEPRIVAPPGTIKDPATGQWTGIPEDKQNRNVYYVSYGTANTVEQVHGNSDEEQVFPAPLDLYYSFTRDQGETYTEFSWEVNPDSSGNHAGETVTGWDRLAKGDPEQGEAQLRMTPDGSKFYATWLAEGEEGSDIWFRRIMPSEFPSNRAPSANATPLPSDDSAAVSGEASIVISPLGNDSDPDGDRLSIVAAGAANHGTVSHNGRTIVYAPGAGFAGDSFTYTVSDGVLRAVANVTVVANDAPEATDDAVTADEDTTIVINVLENDGDPNGDDLSVIAVSAPVNGTATHSGSVVIYTPNANFNGADNLTYTISDGYVDDAATVAIVVNPVNDAPVATDDSAATDEDQAVSVEVLDNDGDLDGDSLSVVAVGAAAHGTVTHDGVSVTYTPQANWSGEDSFTYTVDDGDLSDTATVFVSVNPVNDAPVAADDSAVTDEDQAITVNVLDNDGDLDGDSLTIIAVSAASNGTLTRDGTSVTYVPQANFNGADSFSYTVSDGLVQDTATVDITVNPVNDAPAAADDSAVTDEDSAITIGVLDNDSDLEGDSLTVTGVSAAANGTVTHDGVSVTYTPRANWSGDDSFTYTVDDGDLSDTATVFVTVNPVNDAPLAAADTAVTDEGVSISISVLDNDDDLDGDALLISAVSAASNGTVTHDGASVTYTPDADFAGDDSFTYTVSDGDLSDTATVIVNCAAIPNVAPLAADDSIATDEDQTISVEVLDNDGDPDGDSLSIVAVGAASHGTLIYNGTHIAYLPEANFAGSDSFVYTVSDGELSDTATVVVTVNPVNDAPRAADDALISSEDDVARIEVLDNDGDLDGDTLVISAVGAAANGTVTHDGASVTYTPQADFNGEDSFTYTVSDGDLSETATVFVTVNPVNDAPAAADDSATTDEDQAITI
ncbi:MAG: choice-of-anchor O protein, partial [Anaerolineae bacterium]